MKRLDLARTIVISGAVSVVFASCTIGGLPSSTASSGDAGDGDGGEPGGVAGSGAKAGTPSVGGSAGGKSPTGGSAQTAGTAGASMTIGGESSAGAGGADAAAGAGGDGSVDCGDTLTNANNCGACGHVCSCGACKAGKCQPTVVSGTAGYSNMVAAEGDTAYWNYGADLKKVTPPAAPAGPLASTNAMWGVAVSSQYVYYTGRAASGPVSRVPRAGGAVEPIASGEDLPTGIALYESSSNVTAVWANYGGNAVRGAVNKGTPFTVCSGVSTPVTLAVYQNRVYLEQADGQKIKIHWCDIDPPASGDLVTGLATSGALKQRNGTLFWQVGGAGAATGVVSKYVISTAKTTTPITGIDNGSDPHALALDDDSIYYGDGTALMRASQTGTDKQALATLADKAVTDLAVDNQCVYWTYNNGTIGRVDKD